LSGHDRIRKIGEFLASHRIRAVVVLARELHLRLDARETGRLTL